MNGSTMLVMRWWLVAMAVAALNTGLVTAVYGQDADGSDEPILTKVDFRGGTIKDYCAQLREIWAKSGKTVNIVVMPDAEDVPFPPVNLTSVGLESAMNLILQSGVRTPSRIVEIGVETEGPYTDGESQTFIVKATVSEARPPETKRYSRVWSVSDMLTSGHSAESIITAIETVLALNSDKESAAEVKFHEATALLLANGTKDQLSAIDQVIDEIRSGDQRKRAAELADIGSYDWLRKTVELLQKQVDTLFQATGTPQPGAVPRGK